MSNTNHKHISEDLRWFAEYRKLREWCLAEGDEVSSARCDGPGPYKKIVREVEDERFTQITVECGVNTEALEIGIQYLVERLDTEYIREKKPRTINNPAVMVMEDGSVIRTHGDFSRVLPWLETVVVL